jgi:hypothetical protein
MDPSLDPSAILSAFQKIQEAQLESEKWELKGWYITPEYWGVAIVETESANDIAQNANSWRLVLPGIFKKYNISPVLEVEQYAPVLLKLIRKLKK